MNGPAIVPSLLDESSLGRLMRDAYYAIAIEILVEAGLYGLQRRI
jgi:hypothetical protein